MSIPPPTPLQFSPLSSSINPSFWHALTTLKLQVLKLSDEPVPIWASYARGRTVVDRATGERVGMGAVVELGGEGVERLVEGVGVDGSGGLGVGGRLEVGERGEVRGLRPGTAQPSSAPDPLATRPGR